MTLVPPFLLTLVPSANVCPKQLTLQSPIDVIPLFNIYTFSMRRIYGNSPLARVARFKKIKKAKFGHKHFQKRPNPEK